jgi:plastocyanin
MRVLLPAVAAVLLFPTAANADVTVNAVDGSNTWSQPKVSIKVGETVNWSFEGTATPHNAQNRSSNWVLASDPKVAQAPLSYKFESKGTYTFECFLHKDTMFGEVTVADATGDAGPPPPPPPLSEQPFGNDTPPLSVFEVRDTVVPKLDRVKVARVARGVRVKFRLSEGGKVTVKATRGRSVTTRTVEVAKGTRSITVKGLKAGRYRVQVSAKDLAGNAAKSARRASVTVRR